MAGRQRKEGKGDLPELLSHLELNDGNGRDQTAVPRGSEVAPVSAAALPAKPGDLLLFGKVLPHLFPYLLKPDVLALRQVSKIIQQDIDKFLQNHQSLQPYDSSITAEISKHGLLTSGYFPGPFLKSFQGVRLTTLKQITAFLDQNADPTKNPFFERSVTLIQDLTDRKKNRAEYWNNIFLLLTRFGSNIWYLTLNITPAYFKFCRKNRNSFEYYNRLRKCLELVPNLKTLRLYGSTPRKSQNEPHSAITRELLGCHFHIQANPPPPLPNLQVIEINSQELNAPLRDGIVDFYQFQLKGLRVPLLMLSSEDKLPLTELELTCWPDDQILELPKKLPICAPNLKKLTIRQLTRHCLIDHFLHIVTHFPNLDYLAIIFAPTAIIENLTPPKALVGITADWEVDNPNAMFPKIKYLELKMDIPGVQFDSFVQCFPNLERLMIRIIPKDAMPTGYGSLAENRFNGSLRTGRIYDRVIWEKIGSLKELVHVSEDPHDELEVGNYGQWKEEMDDWQWKPRAEKIVSRFKRATREMVFGGIP